MLTGAKVAFQNQIGARGESPARHGKQDCKTRIAQKLGVRCIGRAQHIKERFLDEILAEEKHAVAPRDGFGYVASAFDLDGVRAAFLDQASGVADGFRKGDLIGQERHVGDDQGPAGATADGLGVTRKTLSDLLNGHSGVSPEMAIRLEKAGWSTADSWLRMQLERDLWETRRRADRIKVKKFATEPMQ